jgi:hypothetical protein
MLLAVLELSDFLVIFLIVFVLSWGAAYLSSANAVVLAVLKRIEHKLDLVLTHLGVDYAPPPKATWQELAGDPARKIAAIKAYREQHGVGLAAAKRAVEDYMEGGGRA